MYNLRLTDLFNSKGVAVEEKINCRYCGTKIISDQDNCHRCGAPNLPEPKSWLQRAIFALKTKQDSVWSDRLATFMPLHFLFALYTLYLGVQIGTIGSLGVLAVVISGLAALFIVMYYPEWYKNTPEKRKDIGQMYFIFLLAHLVLTFSLF